MSRLTRVLVADPDGGARARLRTQLSNSSMRVCGEARTAPQALVAVQQTAPDVVILAAELPGGLYRLIRYLADECGVPSIVLGPKSHDTDVLAVVRAGASAFVRPDQSDLADVAHRVAAGEAVLSGAHMALVLEELRAVELAAERRRRGVSVRLTEREWDVVELLRRGSSTGQIAAELGIAPVTVRTHISAILRRLHVTSRDEALKKLIPTQRSGEVLTDLNAGPSREASAGSAPVLPSWANGI